MPLAGERDWVSDMRFAALAFAQRTLTLPPPDASNPEFEVCLTEEKAGRVALLREAQGRYLEFAGVWRQFHSLAVRPETQRICFAASEAAAQARAAATAVLPPPPPVSDVELELIAQTLVRDAMAGCDLDLRQEIAQRVREAEITALKASEEQGRMALVQATMTEWCLLRRINKAMPHAHQQPMVVHPDLVLAKAPPSGLPTRGAARRLRLQRRPAPLLGAATVGSAAQLARALQRKVRQVERSLPPTVDGDATETGLRLPAIGAPFAVLQACY